MLTFVYNNYSYLLLYQLLEKNTSGIGLFCYNMIMDSRRTYSSYNTKRNARLFSAKRVVIFIIAILITTLVIVAILNRVWIGDFIRGLGYEPTSEMLRIRASLNLTDYGRLVFNASRPELSERETFNQHCRERTNENAILGCYDYTDIYIYNITEPELDGIRELTAAHELLHAVYARLSEQDKRDLRPALEQVYSSNAEILSEEIEMYYENDRYEELYVRAGTEIANLPSKLESHYAKVFEDQDRIAGYYNKYISVFNQIQQNLDVLSAEMNALSSEIESKTNEYYDRSAALNAAIASFNACAETPNCFASEAVFQRRRAELLNEFAALEALYDEIDNLINTYNAKVEEYNSEATHINSLNTIINSIASPEQP